MSEKAGPDCRQRIRACLSSSEADLLADLVERLQLDEAARQAARAGIGFNIDAEEQDRLELSLDVIEALLDGTVAADTLAGITGVSAVAAAGPEAWTRALRMALAERPGPIVPLETTLIAPERYVVERHLCIDTTAAGGNASLLAAADRTR